MIQEVISAIFTGLSIVISAIGGVLVLRNRKQQEEEKQDQADLKYLRRENKVLKDYNILATRHMYRLELVLAQHDIDPPKRPPELDSDPDLPNRPIRDPDTGGFRAL